MSTLLLRLVLFLTIWVPYTSYTCISTYAVELLLHICHNVTRGLLVEIWMDLADGEEWAVTTKKVRTKYYTYLHKLWIVLVHVLNISGKRKKCTFTLWKKYSRPARRTSSQNPYLCQKPTQGRTALRYKNGYINALAITWRHHTQYKMPIKSDISTLYQLRQCNLKL